MLVSNWPSGSNSCSHLSFFPCQRSTGYLALDRLYRNVYMKVVPRSSTELSIVQFLSTDPLRADPRNHTIPVVEFLMAGEWVFIIQASWSPHWAYPPFDKLQTLLEMARQLLEVILFPFNWLDSDQSYVDLITKGSRLHAREWDWPWCWCFSPFFSIFIIDWFIGHPYRKYLVESW